MSFRRIPFQFTSTDPVERQRELEKRFGLPTASNNMYVDVTNPVSMVTGNQSGLSSSPRLQHRVPIFIEGSDHPVKASVDSTNNFSEKKPNVRVIPIEIEGESPQQPSRHRTLSGPAGLLKNEDSCIASRDDVAPLKRSMQDLTKPSKVKATSGPRVHNIPIQIEGKDFIKNPNKLEKVTKPTKKDNLKLNGCHVSKTINEVKSSDKENRFPDDTLKKIEDILTELKDYETGVQEFKGSVKDKQYRYLDEMLTRCMLRLDDIDTMGNESIRSARKNAVKKVQACIDLLESNVKSQLLENNESSNTDENKDIEMKEESALSVQQCNKDFESKSIQIDGIKKEPIASESTSPKVDEIEMVENNETAEVEMTETQSQAEVANTIINEIEMKEQNSCNAGLQEEKSEILISEKENAEMSENELETKKSQIEDDSSVSSDVTNVEKFTTEEKQGTSDSNLEIRTDVEMADISALNLQNELNTETVNADKLEPEQLSNPSGDSIHSSTNIPENSGSVINKELENDSSDEQSKQTKVQLVNNCKDV